MGYGMLLFVSEEKADFIRKELNGEIIGEVLKEGEEGEIIYEK